jgi:hypothetical protein
MVGNWRIQSRAAMALDPRVFAILGIEREPDFGPESRSSMNGLNYDEVGGTDARGRGCSTLNHGPSPHEGRHFRNIIFRC